MTEVIYARVPEAVKAAADGYATERGTTLTHAVVDLLERGLASVSDAPSVTTLEATVSSLKTDNARLEADLASVRAELSAFTAFTQRAHQPVGTCPNSACARAITGYDLLGVGTCPDCGHALTALVLPPESGSALNQRDMLLLLGALGAVLAVAYLASK